MTSSDTSKRGNFSNISYDSGSTASSGRKRVPVSATEIEFLNDIPPSIDYGNRNSNNSAFVNVRRLDTQSSSSSMDKQKQQNAYQISSSSMDRQKQQNTYQTSSSMDKQKQQNTYQTLSSNRTQPQSNVLYQNENDPELNDVMDKLLHRYAPDANPQNASSISTDRRQPAQVKVVKTGDQHSFSTFQTSSPSSTTSHSYSTITRTNKGQTLQHQTQVNSYNDTNSQQNTHTRPATNYDSFQHVIPPPQQQQSQTSVSVKMKNGSAAQVVPGKLYSINDDPLYTIYDKQSPSSFDSERTSVVTTTFQPVTHTYTVTDPLSILFTKAAQKNAQQSKQSSTTATTTTTTGTNLNGTSTFDLGNLLKRVQQDYLHEVQPFVTSVKFVEKDTEFGQTLEDVDFITPVTIEKGFTRQADDILRRSFGRQDGARQDGARQQSNDNDDESEYSDDDDVDELRPSDRYNALDKMDSKQSFTSVTSVSTSTSGYGENYSPANNNRNKMVHSQSTSPPPKSNQTTTQVQMRNPPAAPPIPSYMVTKNETYEKESTASYPPPPKLAERVSSSQYSVTSSESETSNDRNGYSPKYNEHSPPEGSQANASRALQAIATSSPVVKPVGGPVNTGNQVPQRSEDIHPIGPTIRTTHLLNSETQRKKSESEDSDVIASGSDNASESEDEDKSATYNERAPVPSAGRYNVQQVTSSTPTGRDAAPPANARDAVATGRDAAPPANARDAVATGRDAAPPANARDAVATGRDVAPPANARDAVATGRNAAPPAATGRDAAPPAATGRDAAPPAATGRDAAPPAATGRDAAPPAATGRDAAPPAATGRATAPPAATGRDAAPPAATGRDAAPPAATGRDAAPPAATGRDAAPPANAKNANAPPANARDAAANQPATTGGAAQAGSNRIFKSDNNAKYGGKRSSKDSKASIGTKIKSIFRRKK